MLLSTRVGKPKVARSKHDTSRSQENINSSTDQGYSPDRSAAPRIDEDKATVFAGDHEAAPPMTVKNNRACSDERSAQFKILAGSSLRLIAQAGAQFGKAESVVSRRKARGHKEAERFGFTPKHPRGGAT